ncbi:MAG: hypothetical protein Kow0068_07490 [Marinilabiliales bacterium]
MKLLNILIISFFLCNSLFSQNDITLLKPDTLGGIPLMQALKERKTQRDFSDKELSLQQLSNLLWAAAGINRPSGKRTAPTACNWQEIDIYVAMKSGVYYYEPETNALKMIHDRDVRENMGKNKFTADAPVCLIYVSDYNKMNTSSDSKDFYSATDTGFISQNVYLYCASEGLATVVLGYIDRNLIAKELQLKENQKVVLTQCVGYPKPEFQ